MDLRSNRITLREHFDKETKTPAVTSLHTQTARPGFLTDFAAQIPEFEGPVVTSGNDARIVQQELGREHLAAVSREGVLGEKTGLGEPGDSKLRGSQLLQAPDSSWGRAQKAYLATAADQR